MANDRRYLFRGDANKAIGQVFDVGPTPTRLTAGSLTADLRVQVLAGTNVRKADETAWTTFADPSGRPVVLSPTKPYILLIQPGTFRLHPFDVLELPEYARVWLEDATYLGTERIMFTTDVHGHTESEGGSGADSAVFGPNSGNVTVVTDGATLPELDEGATGAMIQFASDTDTCCVTYSLASGATVEFVCGDKLYVTASEYARLSIQYPYGDAKLIVTGYP